MGDGKILGVVLAGGQSSRMGRDKALMPLRQQALLGHCLARLSPQVAQAVLSANANLSRFAGFGLEVLPDPAGLVGRGPLAGILAALDHAERRGYTHLATVPCDAPFLHRGLVASLSAAGGSGEVRCASSARGPEPLFALWPSSAASAVRAFLAAEQSGVAACIGSMPHRFVAIAAAAGEPDPFLNLNRPEDIDAAASMARPG